MPHQPTERGNAGLIKTIRALARPLAPRPTGVRSKIKRIAGVKAVLFDVYGTMLISGSGDISSGADARKTRELIAAARAAGWRIDGARAAAAHAAALDRAIRVRHLQRKKAGIAFPEVNLEQVWRSVLARSARGQPPGHPFGRERIRRLAIEYECRVNPVWPMPGLSDVLPRLKAAGLILGIVSNAQFFTPLVLAAFPETGWARGLFDEDLCAWSYRWKEAKPSSRMLAAILNRLGRRHGIAPGETLVVGNDMRNDIVPASRLGCLTALFAGDARSLRWRKESSECRAVRPSLVLTGMVQLIKVIKVPRKISGRPFASLHKRNRRRGIYARP